MTTKQRGTAIHFVGLAATVVAYVVLFTVANGPVTYLVAAGVGLIAVAVGHRAIKRAGSTLWIAIVALIFAYLEVLFAASLFAVRIARLLS